LALRALSVFCLSLQRGDDEVVTTDRYRNRERPVHDLLGQPVGKYCDVRIGVATLNGTTANPESFSSGV
jgi:hypothetical protein